MDTPKLKDFDFVFRTPAKTRPMPRYQSPTRWWSWTPVAAAAIEVRIW